MDGFDDLIPQPTQKQAAPPGFDDLIPAKQAAPQGFDDLIPQGSLAGQDSSREAQRLLAAGPKAATTFHPMQDDMPEWFQKGANALFGTPAERARNHPALAAAVNALPGPSDVAEFAQEMAEPVIGAARKGAENYQRGQEYARAQPGIGGKLLGQAGAVAGGLTPFVTAPLEMGGRAFEATGGNMGVEGAPPQPRDVATAGLPKRALMTRDAPLEDLSHTAQMGKSPVAQGFDDLIPKAAKAAEPGKPVHEDAMPMQMQGRAQEPRAMGQIQEMESAQPLEAAVAKYKAAEATGNQGKIDEALKAVGRAARPIVKDAADPAEALSKITAATRGETAPGAQGRPASVGASGSQFIERPLPASAEKGAGLLIRQRLGLQERRSAMVQEDVEPGAWPWQKGGGQIRVENDARVADSQAYENNFVKYVETRTANPALRSKLSPELQKAADAIKAHESDMRYFYENLDPDQKIAFHDDYVEHLYKGKKAHAYTGYSATQERVFPTYEDSAKAGWERKYGTLTEAMLEGTAVKNRWIAMKEVGAALKEQGLLKTAQEERPKDWVRINSGEFYGHPVWAPKKIARDYAAAFDHYSGKWAEVVRDINSAARGVAYAGSYYHALTELVETSIGGFGNAVEHARIGNVKGTAKDLSEALSFMGLPKNYLMGRAATNYYRTGKTYPAANAFQKAINAIKGQLSPEGAIIVDRLASGNVPQGRSSLDMALGNVSPWQYIQRHGFLNTLKQGVSRQSMAWAAAKAKEGAAYSAQHPFYAAGNAALGIIKGIAKVSGEIMAPLFGELIPKAKFGANYYKYKMYMEANPGATFEQQLAAVDKIRYNSDNLYGEMVRQNMGWHKFLIVAADFLFQAPGWNIGTARTVGRAAQGLATHPLTSTSMTSPHWNPSVATAFGMILGTMWTGYVWNYLLKGKPPQTFEDVLAPPTGGKSKYGTEARIAPFADASFVGDFMTGIGYPGLGSGGYVYPTVALGGALKGKLNRVPSILIDEFLTGRDYKGQPIFGQHPLKQGVMYALKNLQPFSLGERGAWETPDRANIPLWARLMGVREAGMAYSNPQGFKGFMERRAGKPEDEQKPRHEDSLR